jgi:hypothetical protein
MGRQVSVSWSQLTPEEQSDLIDLILRRLGTEIIVRHEGHGTSWLELMSEEERRHQVDPE